MNYSEFIEILQKKIKRKVTHAELAEILDCSRANISKKVINDKSEVTMSELIKIQEYFDVNLLNAVSISPKQIIKREFEVESAIYNWGSRLNLIAKYNGFSDYEMAKILNIKESRYNLIALKSPEPKISELNAIKSNFDVDIDDILYDTNGLFVKLKQKLEDEKNNYDNLSPKEKEEFRRFLKLKN